ncbi:MAG: hypothetical protein Q8R00_03090 [Candidatus Nanoarchaeia archaeon]|nr:hypothetical protein [Candidatus Nanoarchaeia archaeon]
MQEYMFILGRDPELSLVEIESYFQAFKINHSIKYHDDKIAIFDVDQINPSKVMMRLGGTVKIAELTEDYEYYGPKKAITYSVGIIKGDDSDFLDELKLKFKKEKLKAMFKTPVKDETQVMPSKSANLDLEFLWNKGQVYRVVATSNPKEYKERDEKRPAFDALSAISIRLAKIMINLSQAKHEVLDPFCGQGTILQEGLLMGLNVIGVDKDIASAKENLEWLGKKYGNKWKLIKGDARKLSTNIKEIESVASEPYMGPYWERIPSEEEANKVIKELSLLYLALLKDLKNVLKGKIAIIIPRFKTKGGRREIDINSIITAAGFRLYQPVKAISMPLPYFETKSRLERFIYVLESV